ncbi:MAG: FAD-dependent oxidoreductase [Proteobacteria bacterium]|nr:FAD-dependent oxidoreductase [Pseudomonadota bacterium]MBU1388475.1 FAD-dependent oxidoreductase [Pseudomonadota bacterium]MBU1542701.1 FAD-dependent oxidoreductase [Pseudomonadota bacterium]MBU2481328.1 FAD-dependent oxidoreductase [Pseudomonadota bacterium]
MKKPGIKLLVFFTVVVLIALFFIFDLKQYASMEYLKGELDGFRAYYAQHRLLTMALFLAAYIVMAGLSLPGAAVMSLAGGGLFGLFYGTILVSFGSTIGATLAFLFSRYMFRDWVQNKFSSRLAVINKGVQKEGGFYLFMLRLVPVFPFFLLNLVMGLTPIKTRVFYGVSQIGMLPATLIFVNAGTQLASLESLGGILSFRILVSFALLGIFPFIARGIVSVLRQRKMVAKFNVPARFDYNLAVIGAGSAGLVSSYIAAAVKAKVVLIEEHKMGGDCLNTGCVPSKSLIASAKLASLVNRADEFGFDSAQVSFDFAKVMDRVQAIIRKVAPHDSVERYTQLGVDCISGRAQIISPFEIRVNDQVITTKNIIVATGARPLIPNLPGLDKIPYLTSDTVWNIRKQPERFVILGAGPIGCELAQAFSRLGSKVTLVQRDDAIMKREDPDAAQLVFERFVKEGITVLTHHSAVAVEIVENEKHLVCEHGKKKIYIPFDDILIALGRVPNTSGFGLEALGVELSRNKSIATNDFLQTNFSNIFCCGDVHGRYQFTHTASHEAWYASVNALFGDFKKFAVDYRTIPWTTFTDPEVARVGVNETEAKLAGIDYEVVKYGIDDLDRAMADSEDHGFVKVLTVPGKDRILGVTIVGSHAADIISEFVLAMKHGIGLNKILGTIHIYPTMAEANKSAAGLWKKAHAPEKLLAWVKKYHAWKRK